MMKKTIWIVDDDEGILDAIQIILEQEGYDAIPISDAVGLIERITPQHHPDLILLDLLMSGVDGREICQTFKQRHDTKDIPIVLMTANFQAEKRQEEAGADGLIKKPFDITDLIETVERFLARPAWKQPAVAQ